MNAVLELWKTGQYTEEMMLAAYESHLNFRLALIQADLPCPTPGISVHAEIYRESTVCDDERYESSEWVCKSYGISRAMAVRFMREPPDNVKLTATDETDIRQLATLGLSPLAIAERLGCSSYQVRKALGFERAIIDDVTIESVRNDLAKGFTQKEIALRYGISESSVSNIKPNKIAKPKRRPPSDKDWESLKTSMRLYSISELARMYNISRAYIYARLAKEA